MTLAWHPAIRGDWLVLRRAGWLASARVVGMPALLVACCAALACGDFHAGYGWCLAASGTLALAGSHAIAHARCLGALQRWRFGWCGALPVPRGVTAWTLGVATATALIAALAFAVALLLAAAWRAPHRADVPWALAATGLGLVVGTVVAVARASRRGAAARAHHADGIRQPLFAIAWLDDPRLPHLLDWQRRASLVRWRRGGSFAVVGLALTAVPDGAALPAVAALVVLVLAWAWLAVVVRASADSTTAAMHLLAATPLDARCARRASLRYPLAAALCALVLAAIGTVVGGHGIVAPAWVGCACAVSAWPLARILAVTRNADSSA